MSSDPATVDLQTGSSGPDVSTSGAWSESLGQRPETPWIMGRRIQEVGLLLAMAASPMTAVTDNWFFELQQRDTSTIAWNTDGVIGRPISRAEALRISREILERAERGRFELAEWEAARGIQWGED